MKKFKKVSLAISLGLLVTLTHSIHADYAYDATTAIINKVGTPILNTIASGPRVASIAGIAGLMSIYLLNKYRSDESQVKKYAAIAASTALIGVAGLAIGAHYLFHAMINNPEMRFNYGAFLLFGPR